MSVARIPGSTHCLVIVTSAVALATLALSGCDSEPVPADSNDAASTSASGLTSNAVIAPTASANTAESSANGATDEANTSTNAAGVVTDPPHTGTAPDGALMCGPYTIAAAGTTWTLVVNTGTVSCEKARSVLDDFNAGRGTPTARNASAVDGYVCAGNPAGAVEDTGVAEYCNDPSTAAAIQNHTISDWHQATNPTHFELEMS